MVEELNKLGEKLLEMDRTADMMWNWIQWIESIAIGYQCPYCGSRSIMEKEFRGDDPRLDDLVVINEDETDIFWYCPECDLVLLEPHEIECETILSDVMSSIDGLMEAVLDLRKKISEMLDSWEVVIRSAGDCTENQ